MNAYSISMSGGPQRVASARKNVIAVVILAYAAVTVHNLWIASRGGVTSVPMAMFGLCQLTPAAVVLLYDRGYLRRLGKLLSRTGGWRPMIASYAVTALAVGACIALPYTLGLVRMPFGAEMTASYPLRDLIPTAFLRPEYFWIYVLFGAPIIHLVTATGEEILWRGYLLDQTLELLPDRRKVYFLNGVLWGIWHLPMIVMLHWDFPNHVVIGPLLITGSQILWSLVLVQVRIKTDSLWPVIVMHALANAMTIGLYDRLIDHAYNPLFSPWGLLGGLVMGVVAWKTVRIPGRSAPGRQPDTGGAPTIEPGPQLRPLAAGPAPSGLELLEFRNGIRYYLFEDAAKLPTAEVCEMVEAAWAHDYRDRAILKFDADYLRWLMPAAQFFGILAIDADGRPVGMELGLDRVVRIGGRRHRVSYVTLLTVVPTCRGQGVAQAVLRHLTHHAVTGRGAEMLISVFDDNAAGMPTVEKHLSASAAWTMKTSPAYTVWAAAPDLLEVDRYEPLKGAARAALLPGIRHLLQFRPRPVRSVAVLTDEPAAAPTDGDQYTVAFEHEASLPAMYGASPAPSSGELRVRSRRGPTGAMSYHVLEIMRSGLPDRPMAQIQMIRAGGEPALLTRHELTDALRMLNTRMFEAGSICAFLVNSVALPSSALLRAGYLPTERKVRVALRGPRPLIEQLGDLAGPWLVDIL